MAQAKVETDMISKRHRSSLPARTFAFIAAALIACGNPAKLQAQTTPTKLSNSAAIETQIARSGKSRVIIHLANGTALPATARMMKQTPDRAAALSRIRNTIDTVITRNFATGRTAAGGAIKRFTLLPAFAAEISQADLARLKSDPSVIKIEPDEIKQPVLAASLPLIGVPSSAGSAAAEPSGYDRTVAVIDTGVQASHPFISPRVVAEACFLSTTRCPNGSFSQTGPGAAAPASGQSHGTHVSGIAVGSYGTGSPLQRGVASKAGLIMVNVFGSQGGAYTSDIIRGLEYIESLVSANGNAYHIDAINMSLGGGIYSGTCDFAAEKPIIDLLRSEGVLTVVAAGNNGSRTQMTSPACISSVVSVAATNKQGGISSYTNINANTTLAAPGGDFDSLGCITSSISQNGYGSMCGTSMAAPHVAGAIGLLRQARPNATVTEIIAALTAGNMPTVTDTRSGGISSKPFLRADMAIANLGTPVVNGITVSKSVSGAGSADGTVTSTPTGISCGAICNSTFPAGSTITLSASPDAKSRFAGWTGACSGTTPTCSVSLPLTASDSTNVTALFSDATVSLNTALDDTLLWSTEASTGDVGNWFGQTVVVRSGDTTGSARSAAIGDNESSSIGTTVTGPGILSFYWSVSSEANADFLSFSIDDVRQAGQISGSVGFVQQSWSIPSGTHVLKWTYAKNGAAAAGADAGYLDTVLFTPAPPPKTFTLDVRKTNSSYGSVTSSPVGIDCGTACGAASASYVANTRVKLTAKAVAGRRFSSWSGACSGPSVVCNVTMSASRSVTANFR